MYRILALSCLTICIGQHQTSHVASAHDFIVAEKVVGKEGTKDAHRDRVTRYFNKLATVKSAEEEERVLTELSVFLNKHRYKIKVERKDEKHLLLCPYFPPITPWVEYSFHDIENLKLLPRLKP